MKVRFSNGTEVSVTKVSSQYSLGIASTDPKEIAKFQELLTTENLSKFQIIDDEDGDKVKFEATNFKLQAIATNDAGDESSNETNFILCPLSDLEIKVLELEAEKELQAGAIEELAGIVAGGE